MPDRTSRFRCQGHPVYHYMGCSTFSQYTVITEISCCKIPSPSSTPLLSKLCLLGCGIPTGYGAAIHQIQPGDTVAIFGLGCVGLSVVQGAKQAGAKHIIGIDMNPKKEEIARQFGMHTFLLASPSDPNALETLKNQIFHCVEGGVDVSFECIGKPDVMRLALEVCHKGWGTSVIIGVAGSGEEISTRPFQLVTGRTWKGSAFGGYKSRSELPNLIREYEEGKLKIDEYITHRFLLQDINQAFDAMHSGTCIRAVLEL
ncbi:hypothetical protein HMI54_013682 [Coelomomyces lativittatus]|nr:hypothetical protein HMI55_006704 [Coelomomyces lativittatus]KAJ1514713.1 hypothetical protein HMI54_013682 [Coelomomyces lativittatus]